MELRAISPILVIISAAMIFSRCSAQQKKTEEQKFGVNQLMVGLNQPTVGVNQPMVAFVCHLPAMHLTNDGWKPDEATTCLKDPDAILKYCQKMYSHLTIVDTSESAHAVRITNWCQSSHKQCNSHSYFVKPFRCLVRTSTPTPTRASTQETPRKEPEVTTERPLPPDDAYLLFIRNTPETNLTEHEFYVRARNALRQRHRVKMAKVMEQWSRMNQTADRAWDSDRQSSEDLRKQITTRFQKLYEALLQEEKYEDHQLNELHQQRVQAELNRLKRDSLDAYMKALRDEPVDPALILKSLKHYIRMEERDSEHTISRFNHIRKKDIQEAENIVSYVVEHLKVIDRRVRQALDMLDRVPKHKKMILRLAEPFLKEFDTLDESIAAVTGEMIQLRSSVTHDVSRITDVVTKHSTSGASVASSSTTEAGAAERKELKEEDNNNNDIKDEDTKKEISEETNEDVRIGEKEKQLVDSPTTASMTTVASETTDLETNENVVSTTTTATTTTTVAAAKIVTAARKRSEIIRKVKLDHVAFMQKSEHRLNEVDFKERNTIKEPSSFIATPIGMTVFSIALVLLIALALIILHRRVRSSTPATVGGNNRSSRNRFLVSRKPSSKKAGVSNGYENPTYRYLNSAPNP